MTPEQLKLQAQARRRRAEAEAGQATGAAAAPAPTTPAAAPQNAPTTAPLEEGAMGTLKALGLGGVRGMAGLGHGVAQLATKAFGSDEALTASHAEEAKRRKFYEDKFKGHETAGAVGEIGGAVIPAVVGGLATGGVGAAGALPAAARFAGSMAGGAVGGGATPLTAEEEAAGDRAKGAGIGATIGAVVPGLGAGKRAISEVLRRGKRALPEEAVGKFAERLGFRGARSPLATQLRGEVTGEVGRLKKAAAQAYDQLEMQPGLPKVELKGTNAALSNLTSLSDQVNETKYPALKKLLTKVQEGTGDQATGLVDPQGNPITKTAAFTFRDARQTRRGLKVLHRKMLKANNTDAADQVASAIDKIDNDLDVWEQANKLDVNTKARAVDKAYDERIMPFRKGKLGRYTKEDTTPTSLLTDQGEVAEDVMRRVPGAQAPMRALQGAKLAEGTPASQASALTSFPMETVLSDQERQYARQLAAQLRERGAPQQFIEDFLSKRLKGVPISDRLARTLGGVEEMGYTAPGSPSYLRNAMISYGLASPNYEE